MKIKESVKELLNLIFPVVKSDPVKNCIIYKKEGCTHVDGPLCDVNECSHVLKENNVLIH